MFEEPSGGGGSESKVDDGHRQPPERVWERLVSAHSFGDCLITVSTGQMTDAEAERVGLVPTHAYAVLDVRDVQGKRLLLVKVCRHMNESINQ